jgi:hypothetical protein
MVSGLKARETINNQLLQSYFVRTDPMKRLGLASFLPGCRDLKQPFRMAERLEKPAFHNNDPKIASMQPYPFNKAIKKTS